MLNDDLIDHPAATFFVRGSGDSMTGASLHDGELLVVAWIASSGV
jgi:DNA polymerase V